MVEAGDEQLRSLLSSRLLDRRGFLGGVGLALFCAACGMPAASPSASSAATIHDTLHGAAVPATQRIPATVLQRLASAYDGTWKGRWINPQGTGTATVQFAIDLGRRVATTDMQVDGIPFGHAPLPHVIVEVFLDGYSYDATDISYDLEGFGAITIHRGGGGTGTGTLSKPVYDTSVQKLDVTARYLEGRGADMTYECTLSDGTTTLGAVRWSRNGDAVPTLPSSAALGLEAFVHGDYAASLLTAPELTAALGRNIGALTANGGRAGYAPGVDLSNARAANTSGDQLVVQITIFRLATPAAALEYLRTTLAPNVPAGNYISGLGDIAYVQPSVPDVFVLQRREIADIQVLDPTGRNVAAEKAVARALLTRLGA
ncbi:MAG: hypothetical protein M3140_06185 [Actinomycetota bacterium]|nr:hypothetical protein [Actinomycetota bacterium]